MNIYLKNPKLIVILGYPLEHTFSPLIHNFAFQYLNLDYVYSAFPIEPHRMQKLGKDYLKILPVAGGNVTIPFKEKIFAYLDIVSPEALKIGAVNTFYKKNGIVYGENTDLYGFIASVENYKECFQNKKVLLLGTGGSAKAVSTAFEYLGVKEVFVVSRERESSEIFARNKRDSYLGINWITLDYKDLMSYNHIKDFSVVVNTTPLGMYDNLSPLPESFIQQLNPEVLVYDLIYNPAETTLLKIADKCNFRNINGLSMLVNQAAKAFEFWTGEKFPTSEVQKYLKENGII